MNESCHVRIRNDDCDVELIPTGFVCVNEVGHMTHSYVCDMTYSYVRDMCVT